MERVLVRPAEPDDAAGIACAHIHAWQSAYRGLIDQELLDRLDLDQRTRGWRRTLEEASEAAAPGLTSNAIIVCTVGETVAGWAAFGPGRDDGMTHFSELAAIYAHPDFWNRGIGHRLLERVEQQLLDAGWQEAYLWVLEGNERAISFYESHGWAADGKRKDLELGAGVIIQEQCHRRDLLSARPPRA